MLLRIRIYLTSVQFLVLKYIFLLNHIITFFTHNYIWAYIQPHHRKHTLSQQNIYFFHDYYCLQLVVDTVIRQNLKVLFTYSTIKYYTTNQFLIFEPPTCKEGIQNVEFPPITTSTQLHYIGHANPELLFHLIISQWKGIDISIKADNIWSQINSCFYKLMFINPFFVT